MKTITKKVTNLLLAISMFAYFAAMPAVAATVWDAYEPVLAAQADEIIASSNNVDYVGKNNITSVITFDSVDFGNNPGMKVDTLYANVAMDAVGGGIDIYMDATDASSPDSVRSTGKKMASITTMTTGAWDAWEEQKSEDIFISRVTGTHSLHILFTASTCGDLKSIRFELGEANTVQWTLDQEIPAVKYDDISVSINNGTYLGQNNTGYVRYDGVDFGEGGAWSELGVEVGVSNEVATRKLSVYILNDESMTATSRQEIVDNGTLIASIATVPTGDWNQFEWQYSKSVTPDVSGVHSVYVIFDGNYTGNLKTLLFSTVRKTSAYEKIEAENANQTEGCRVDGGAIGATNNNSWARFDNIDFDGGVPNYCIVKAGAPEGYANGTVEVYVGNMDSTDNLVASVKIKQTSDWNDHQKNYVELDDAAKAKLAGTQTVYLKFLNGDGPVLGNVDNFQFAESFNDAYEKPMYGEDASSWHESLSTGSANYNGEEHIKFGGTNNGYWIMFENVDFGQFAAKDFSLIYGAPEQTTEDAKAKSKINVYLDNTSSDPIFSELAENTGGYNEFKECGPYTLDTEITGLHDVYVTFGYSGTCDFMGISFTPSVEGLIVVDGSLVLYDVGGEVVETTPDGALMRNTDFIEASCTIANNSGEDAEAALILAVYEPDGTLARVAVETRSFAKNSITPDFSAFIDFMFDQTEEEIPDTTGYYVKAMVWTDLEGMTPLPGGSL